MPEKKDIAAVLLSIKPEYVEKIRSETKKYELRRKIWDKRRFPINVAIYETSPVKAITGIFWCDGFIEAHKDVIWDQYNELLGVNFCDYFKYFTGINGVYALRIDNYLNTKPLTLDTIGISYPPQNLQYLTKKQWQIILDKMI